MDDYSRELDLRLRVAIYLALAEGREVITIADLLPTRSIPTGLPTLAELMGRLKVVLDQQLMAGLVEARRVARRKGLDQIGLADVIAAVADPGGSEADAPLPMLLPLVQEAFRSYPELVGHRDAYHFAVQIAGLVEGHLTHRRATSLPQETMAVVLEAVAAAADSLGDPNRSPDESPEDWLIVKVVESLEWRV